MSVIRNAVLSALIIGCTGVSALSAADDTPAPLPSPAVPGRFTLAVKSGDSDRVAHVHIPKGYKPEVKPPLVVVLHGAGGNGTSALDRDGWAAKADKEGFVVVAPDGLPARPRLPADFRTNPLVWNSGQLSARSPRAAIDDVAFVRDLLDALITKTPHDPARVYCVGHSNGGGMTFRLATELSERFTAVGMVAGLMAVENPKPKKAIPTLYILGTKDPLMPVDGGEVKTPWGSRQNQPVSEMLAKWAEGMGCEKDAKVVSDKDEVRKVTYTSKSKGAALTVLYLEGHGHHWPGAKPSLPESMIGPIKSKLNATDALWEFLNLESPKPK